MLMNIDHGELRIKAIAATRSSQLTLLKRLTDELDRLASDYYAMLIDEARDALQDRSADGCATEDCGDILADVIDALDDIAFFNDAEFINDGEYFRFIKMQGVYHA